MAKKKIGPLAQAINLYNDMDERDQNTLADYIRSRPRPKSSASSAPSAEKKSSRKSSAQQPIPNIGDAKGECFECFQRDK